MTWVPPYAVSACQQRLNESFDGASMKDGITHLGLQFWNPTATGEVKLVTRFRETINDAKIAEFRKWGDAHNVGIMLCIYNATAAGWDWGLASSAFATHRTAFVEALVNETLRLQLDGVDIDFEGKGQLDASKDAYVLFIKELSERLHAEGKELTLDTFAYKWNAPRQSWWPALLPHIDGLHVMGYAETGAGAADWRSYAFLKAATAAQASKLLIGVPGGRSKWQGSSAKTHLQWIVDDGSAGLAIWDARVSDPIWRTKEIWQTIAKLKRP
jgi:hypothetical protein